VALGLQEGPGGPSEGYEGRWTKLRADCQDPGLSKSTVWEMVNKE